MAIGGFSAIVNISIRISMALDKHTPAEAWLHARMVKKLLLRRHERKGRRAPDLAPSESSTVYHVIILMKEASNEGR